MQRLFSMFADGMAGVGLLILRLGTAASFWFYSISQAPTGSSTWALIGVGVAAMLIGIGALTPISCGIGCLMDVYYISHPGALRWESIFPFLGLLALALLGPGAYSVDARLFGRRRIVLRDEED